MIEIEDDVVVEKHDVWKSEIRVKGDKAVRKILKHFKKPKGKNEKSGQLIKPKEVIKDENILRVH